MAKPVYVIKESTLNKIGDKIREMNGTSEKMSPAEMESGLDVIAEKLQNSEEEVSDLMKQEYYRGLDLGLHHVLYLDNYEAELAYFPHAELHYITSNSDEGKYKLGFVFNLGCTRGYAINGDSFDSGYNVDDEESGHHLMQDLSDHSSRTLEVDIPFDRLQEEIRNLNGNYDYLMLCEKNIEELTKQI